MAHAFAVFFGVRYGACAPLFPATVADVFHGKSFGIIYGVIQIGIAVGAAAGPWFGGYIFDATEGYSRAFMVAMIAMVISCICIWRAATPHQARLVLFPKGR